MKHIYIHRKESVVLSAIEIIDELGIQGLSTKEIAKRQDISEGTLFKHFRSKNEIILSVLEYFSQFDSDLMESAVNKKLSFIEAVRYFIISLAEYYENYPAITSLINAYEVLRWDEEICEKYKSIIQKRSSFIKTQIEKGIQQGLISNGISSEIITDLVLGFCSEITLRWRMSRYDFSLKEKIAETFDTVIKNFLI